MNSGLFLATAAGGLLAGGVAGLRWPRTWLVFTLVGSGAAVAGAVHVLGGAPAWEWRAGFAVGGEPVHLRLDALSAFFLALVGVVSAAGATYAHGYWTGPLAARSAARGRVAWNALALNLVVVLVAANGLHFLIGWELFTVSAFFLLTLDRTRVGPRRAGWLYLAASHTGTLALFAFFALLAVRTGTWELGPLRDRAELAPLFWFALFGFGVKAGLFPLHVWLPSAHASAPSHVSAILSGVAIKMGLYGIVRFSGWLPVPAAAPWLMLGLGAGAAVLGIAFALAQDDLKRLLAYCSVENVGIIVMALGAALLGSRHGDAAWGRLALAGALLHVWNHGLFKVLLFFGAGSVLHATGTRDMSRLGGLWRRMPWTAGCFAVGALAVSALPPLNGFVSEWLIYLGLFDAVTERGPVAPAAVPAAILLGTSGALALAAFAKAMAIVFLGAPRTPAAARAGESGPLMLVPMVLLAAACLGLGLMPGAAWPAIARATAAWHPGAVASAAPAALAPLVTGVALFAAAATAAAIVLWRRVQAAGLRRAPTWDCGYARPTSRMQYTSGSFAATAAGWFGWMLRPERALRRPRGPFPARASLIERVPETVLERAIVPVATAVVAVSTAVRRLQHGRIQFYIVYGLAGLIGLAVLVWWGEAP